MPRSTDRSNPKKLSQVSVKMDGDLYDRLLKACEIQQHREGQLARILIEWAIPFYERARSVEDLYAASPDIGRAIELERTVYEQGKGARDRKQKDAEVSRK